MRTKYALIGLLACMVIAVAFVSPEAHGAEPGGRSLSLSATHFDFEAEPGQAGSGEVFVSNEGADPIFVRIYVADQSVSETGSVSYSIVQPETNALTSPASWVTVNLPESARYSGNIPYLELGPGGRLPVTFDVEVPEGAAPGDKQAILFFEMFSPDTPQGGTARVNARIGARIKTRVKGEIVESVDVRPFTVPAFVIGRTIPFEFTARNEGNIDQRVQVHLVQRDRSENDLASTVAMEDAVLYASTASVGSGELKLEGLGFGSQQLTLVMEYTTDAGLERSVEKSRSVWVVPLWFLIVLSVAVVVFIGSVIWAMATRVARKKASAVAPVPDFETRFAEDPMEPSR